MRTISRMNVLLLLVVIIGVAARNNHHNNQYELTTTTAYEARLSRMERQLQPDAQSFCADSLGTMISCLAQECFADPCQSDPSDVTPPPEEDIEDCDSLTRSICSIFDDTCCPNCSDATDAYLDCVLNFTVGSICPNATCTYGELDFNAEEEEDSDTLTGYSDESSSTENATTTTLAQDAAPFDSAPADETTEPAKEEATESPTTESTTTLTTTEPPADECGKAAGEMILCMLNNCFGRSCDTDLSATNTTPGPVENCDDFEMEFCSYYDATEQCCPQCSTQILDYLNCYLQSALAAPCPGLTCDIATRLAITDKTGIPNLQQQQQQHDPQQTTWQALQRDKDERQQLSSSSSSSIPSGNNYIASSGGVSSRLSTTTSQRASMLMAAAVGVILAAGWML